MTNSIVKTFQEVAREYVGQIVPGRTNISYHTCSISPSEALDIIKKQASNRFPSAATIAFYVQEMKSGNFLHNGETLIFDENLRLLDGQHRMRAIIESGVTIVSTVALGIPSDRFHTMDQGKKRTPADIIHMSDIDATGKTAAIAKRLHAWANRYFPKNRTVSGRDIIRILKNHPEIIVAKKILGRHGDILRRADFEMMYYLLMQHRDGGIADEYFSFISRGDSIPERNVTLVVRDFFIQKFKSPVATSSGKIIDTVPFRVMLTGWNFFSKGKKAGHSAFWSEVKRSAEDPNALFKIWSPCHKQYIEPVSPADFWLFGEAQ